MSTGSKCFLSSDGSLNSQSRISSCFLSGRGTPNVPCSATSVCTFSQSFLSFNGVFSLPVSVSFHLCFSPLLFISPSSFCLSVCVCGVFLSLPGRWWLQSDFSRLHSQAKHQNTQHWWVTLKMNSSQLPDAGQYLAVAAVLDLCTNHCGKETAIC